MQARRRVLLDPRRGMPGVANAGVIINPLSGVSYWIHQAVWHATGRYTWNVCDVGLDLLTCMCCRDPTGAVHPYITESGLGQALHCLAQLHLNEHCWWSHTISGSWSECWAFSIHVCWAGVEERFFNAYAIQHTTWVIANCPSNQERVCRPTCWDDLVL